MADDEAKQPPNEPPLPEEKKGELLAKTTEHTIRFAGLANAGGALATATVISATAKDGEIMNILAVPLALFAIGVVCALLTTASLVFSVGDITRGETVFMPPPFKWVAPFLEKILDAAAVGMVACFILGCAFGVLVIAFA